MEAIPLARHLRAQFQLDWMGIHGASHWARVRAIGLYMARVTGADPLVVELFAWLHDTQRLNDGHDPLHGDRSARYARSLQGEYFDLTARQLDLLQEACRHHSDGFTDGDITVRPCWDADRLDLGRVGITPDPERLCTPIAQDEATRALAQGRAVRWAGTLWR